MIKSVHFKNFKALRDATLPLSPLTVIVGPNGSGKSTALYATRVASGHIPVDFNTLISCDFLNDLNARIEVRISWDQPFSKDFIFQLSLREGCNIRWNDGSAIQIDVARATLHKMGIFSFQSDAISKPTVLRPGLILGPDGACLSGVLDQMRDAFPEGFEKINGELNHCLPEFDRILFETPGEGQRSLCLRTSRGHHKIAASELSSGTLMALAILTLAYLPSPPPIVGIEEPDHGIHPRLLRDIRDALYRLAYPKEYGESREPVQVLVTTHSPYMLDLFKDHPEEIVIAQKTNDGVKFEQLSQRPDLDEILQDASLGDIWYSGVLGGVPSGS